MLPFRISVYPAHTNLLQPSFIDYDEGVYQRRRFIHAPSFPLRPPSCPLILLEAGHDSRHGDRIQNRNVLVAGLVKIQLAASILVSTRGEDRPTMVRLSPFHLRVLGDAVSNKTRCGSLTLFLCSKLLNPHIDKDIGCGTCVP